MLYGSESELDDSDDEVAEASTSGVKNKKVQQDVRLRVDDDEPMDLLQEAATRITSVSNYFIALSMVVKFGRHQIKPPAPTRPGRHTFQNGRGHWKDDN